MTVDYWTLHDVNHPNSVSLAELSTMEYLRQNTDPAMYSKDVADYALAFTLTDESYQTLQAFSGTGTYAPYSYKGRILFDAQQLGEPLSLFNSYQTRYLYMTQRDYEQLSHLPNSFLGQYLRFLPKPFENGSATIYEIPQLSPPLLNSGTAIVLPTNLCYPASWNDALLMFAKSLCNYTIFLDSDAGLWSKTVLVLPSDPRTPVAAFVDESFTDGWQKSADELTSTSDGHILTLSYDNRASSSELVSYETQFPEVINASENRYLVWRVFIQDMVEDYENLVDYAGIRLYDANEKSWFWVGAVSLTNSNYEKINKGVWVDVTFDTQSNNWHQFESVSKIQIALRVSPNSAQKIKIAHLSLQKSITSVYDANLPSELIKWVNDGGTLMVVNSDGVGDFSKLMNLEQSTNTFKADKIETDVSAVSIPSIEVTPLFSKDSTVENLGHYKSERNETSFAFCKSIGKGELWYLFAEPYISAMENSVDDNERVQLFNNLDCLLEALNFPLSFSGNMISEKYGTAISQASFLGYTTLDSDYMILPKELKLLDISVNSTDSSSILLTNRNEALLSDFKAYGDVNWIINAQNVNITSEGLGFYSKVLIGGDFEVTLHLNPNSSICLKLQDLESGDITSATIENGNLSFRVNAGQPLELFVRTPKIFTTGTSNLKSLYRDKILFDYEGTDVTITGQLSFAIAFSDTYTLISDFKMEENTQMEKLKSGVVWDEWGDVPWVNVLASVENVLLMVIVLLIISHLVQMGKLSNPLHNKKAIHGSVKTNRERT
jgi:hypothetical protein